MDPDQTNVVDPDPQCCRLRIVQHRSDILTFNFVTLFEHSFLQTFIAQIDKDVMSHWNSNYAHEHVLTKTHNMVILHAKYICCSA